MNLLLFGNSNASAESLKRLISENKNKFNIILCSRKKYDIFIDLDIPSTSTNLRNFDKNSILVSFAPIWKMASFWANVDVMNPGFLKNIKTIIACSSSSIITKRFASNKFDKDLYAKLLSAEEKLIYPQLINF